MIDDEKEFDELFGRVNRTGKGNGKDPNAKEVIVATILITFINILSN